MGGIAIIVTSSRLQMTLRVETCVELELSLPESDLEPSLLKNTEIAQTILCLKHVIVLNILIFQILREVKQRNKVKIHDTYFIFKDNMETKQILQNN